MSILERARNELQAGKSGNDAAKLASAESLAVRATGDLDQLLNVRIADVKPADVEDTKTPTTSGPTRTQIAAADRSLIEARSARDAMSNTISGSSPDTADRRRGDQLGQELDRIANEISRAKRGNDGQVLVTATTRLDELIAEMRVLETRIAAARPTGPAGPGETTPQGGGETTPQPPTTGVPTLLRAAAQSYFAADYQATLDQLEGADWAGKAKGQALLFRAAAHFALYNLSGDAASRDAAQAAVAELRGFDPTLQIQSRYFSPNFVDFFNGGSD